MNGDTAYRAAAGIALGTAFLLIWISFAVGVIGTEDNPANLMFGAVLLLGLIGAVAARFQPEGMARALAATALAQGLVALIALIAERDAKAFVLTAIFMAPSRAPERVRLRACGGQRSISSEPASGWRTRRPARASFLLGRRRWRLLQV